MTYKSRHYSEKDGHKLMKAIIAQEKRYNNEQERKRYKTKEMNTKNSLEGIGGNVGDVINNFDLVIASNTQESQEHNINTCNCDELPESTQRAPRELPESSHLQALVKYLS